MKRVVIVAGEPSGDTLGAGLVREFLKLEPQVEFFGVGGDKMAAAGVRLICHIDKLAFLGFWEVVKNLRVIKRVQRQLLREINRVAPQMAILIDYPGFNLRLAPKLKRRGIKVFYYISPQIWAWGASRIRKIKENVDMMTAIFEFERDIYEQAGVPVRWVGHPLLDEIHITTTETEFRRKFAMADSDTIIGLFPGSRLQEVRRILPEMLAALDIIEGDCGHVTGMIGKAPGLKDAVYDEIIQKSGRDAIVCNGLNFDLMAHAKLNIVCSGTATLECAIIGKPLAVVYKTSSLTYHIARWLINIPHIGMVNVVGGKQIVPELIQRDCNPKMIAVAARRYLVDSEYYENVKKELLSITPKLGSPGASMRAAEAALALLRREGAGSDALKGQET